MQRSAKAQPGQTVAGPGDGLSHFTPRRLALALLLLGGLTLRLWGIGWGIPEYDPAVMPITPYRHSYHIDEDNFLAALVLMQPERFNFDVLDYHWGTLQHYLIYAALVLASVVGLVPAPWEEAYRRGDVAALPSIFLVGRLVSVAAGVIGVWVVARLGAALAGWRAGLFAGGAYALAPLPVVGAHYLTNDITMSSLLAGSLLALVLAVERSALRLLYLGAFLVGLSIAAKYSAIFALAALPVAVYALWRAKAAKGSAARRVGAIMLVPPLLVIVGFLVGEPYAVVPGKLSFGLQQVATGNLADPAGGLSTIMHVFIWQLRSMVDFGLAWPLGIVAVAGVLLMVVRVARKHAASSPGKEEVPGARRASYALVLAALLSLGASLMLNRVEVVRYTHPLLPAMCVGAGLAWAALPRGWLRVGVALVTLLPAGAVTLGQLTIMSEPHPANQLQAWLRSELKPGASVARLWPEYPLLHPTLYSLTRLDPWRPDLAPGSRPDYVIMDNMAFGPPTDGLGGLLATEYEPVARFGTKPHIGPFVWDEGTTPHDWKYSHPSFTVYARRE